MLIPSFHLRMVSCSGVLFFKLIRYDPERISLQDAGAIFPTHHIILDLVTLTSTLVRIFKIAYFL